MRSLASLFGRSPFGPMQKHMEKVAECAAEVPALVEALVAGDRAVLEAQRGKISSLETEAVLSDIDAVGRLEDESDELELALTRILFTHEDSMSPVAVILWMRIFEWIGDLADYPKKVCNRLHLLIAS